MLVRRLSRISVFALCLYAAGVHAQSTNATIYGSVLDTTGAAVAKASISALNTKTGIEQSSVSNNEGVYIFPALQPGEYTVTATLAGFRKAIASNIQLAVGARISVNLRLEVGAATESVTVVENSSPL